MQISAAGFSPTAAATAKGTPEGNRYQGKQHRLHHQFAPTPATPRLCVHHFLSPYQTIFSAFMAQSPSLRDENRDGPLYAVPFSNTTVPFTIKEMHHERK
jgi:hypothetical protein